MFAAGSASGVHLRACAGPRSHAPPIADKSPGGQSGSSPLGRPHKRARLQATFRHSRAGVCIRTSLARLAAAGEAAGEAAAATELYPPLEGEYHYKHLKALSVPQLKAELQRRGLPDIGYRTQLAGRLYQAFIAEGRGLFTMEGAAPPSDGEDPSGRSDEDDTERDEGDPLLGGQRSCTGWRLSDDTDEEPLLSNSKGLQITFLPSGSAPNGVPTAGSVALRTLQSVWLFDCGEDAQRGLLGHRLIDFKRVERIFLGSMSPEAVLGLPGILCTLSSSREKGLEAADVPVHVYGPQGLVQFVSAMLSVSRTYLEMPVVLHEFTPRAVTPEQMRPTEVLRRSRLYAVPLPPDQLNPLGFYDAMLAPMLTRHTRKRTGGGTDLRSGLLPQVLPPPGDPSRTGLAVSEMTWTIRADLEWMVQAVPLKSRGPCLGFVIDEVARSGRLYPEVAEALGVSDRQLFTELKEGRAVRAVDGSIVTPEQCVGTPRAGRRVAIVPPCEDSAVLASRGAPVDLVVHSAVPPSFGTGPLVEGDGMQLARVAGRTAAAMRARELVLWQPMLSFNESAQGRDEAWPATAVAAAGAGGGEAAFVSIASCMDLHSWDRDDGGSVPPELPEGLEHMVASAGQQQG